MVAQALLLDVVELGDQPSQDAGLDQAAGLEHILRLLGGRLGDEGAALRDEFDDLLVRQPRQHFADLRAIGAEDGGQPVFAQLGAGRQTVFEDRRRDLLGDLIGAVFAGGGPVGCAGGNFADHLDRF